MKQFSPLLGLLGVLAISAWLDLMWRDLQRTAGRTFEFGPVAWGYAIVPLVWVALIGLLAWWTLFRVQRNAVVLGLLIAIGLVVHLIPVSLFTVGTYWAEAIPGLRSLLLDLGSSTLGLTTRAGAFAALIGLFGLFPRKAFAGQVPSTA